MGRRSASGRGGSSSASPDGSRRCGGLGPLECAGHIPDFTDTLRNTSPIDRLVSERQRVGERRSDRPTGDVIHRQRRGPRQLPVRPTEATARSPMIRGRRGLSCICSREIRLGQASPMSHPANRLRRMPGGRWWIGTSPPREAGGTGDLLPSPRWSETVRVHRRRRPRSWSSGPGGPLSATSAGASWDVTA